MHTLSEVKPQRGDYVKVIDSGAGCYAPGCHWDGEVSGAAASGLHRVHYKGRFYEMAIEPDWDIAWPVGSVQYRELVPQPADGLCVYPRVGDDHPWVIHLVLFTVDARRAKRDALTFDAFHLVVLSTAPPQEPDWELYEPQPIPEYSEPDRYMSLGEMLEYRQRWEVRAADLQQRNARNARAYAQRLADYEHAKLSWNPEFTRCWVRWCYSSHAFIPVGDPAVLRKLKGCLPDAQVETPLFGEVQ